MIDLLRRFSNLLLFTVGVVAFMSAMLPNSSLGESLSFAAGVGLIGAGVCRVPLWIRNFRRGPQLMPRPRQRSRSLLTAPGSWRSYNAGLLLFWAGTMLLSLLQPEPFFAYLLILLSLPLALALFIHQAVEPGAGAERRTLAAQLAAGLRAGLNLPDLLKQLQVDASREAATRFRPLPLALHWLEFDMRCGSLFSTAIATQSFFPPLWSSLVRIGERTGRIPECLGMLAHWEANQPRRLYLLRPLICLPLVLVLARLIATSLLFEQQAVPKTFFHPLVLPFLVFISASFGLAFLSLLGPWLQRFRRFRRLTEGLQRAPWIWPLARVEEQLLAVTALEAAACAEGNVEEMLELAREACTRADFRRFLDPRRAAAGDTLATILGPNFEGEVVALVAAGEAQGDLLDCLNSARLFLEGRLQEERNRVELRFLVGFQILTGLLVLCSALEYLLSLQTMYLSILDGA